MQILMAKGFSWSDTESVSGEIDRTRRANLENSQRSLVFNKVD